jgi:hypothetical protein
VDFADNINQYDVESLRVIEQLHANQVLVHVIGIWSGRGVSKTYYAIRPPFLIGLAIMPHFIPQDRVSLRVSGLYMTVTSVLP